MTDKRHMSASTAAGIAAAIFLDPRFKAWWTDDTADRFEGHVGLYEWIAETAIYLDDNVPEAHWEELHPYSIFDLVSERLLSDKEGSGDTLVKVIEKIYLAKRLQR